ncbi:hypothetical protein [Lonepinella sp. BR2930]|uniref:hypothetical protein n=1 Tax=Lonepinella sp. BR2930 TaxID=3434554 RepID=UPI003F6DC16E
MQGLQIFDGNGNVVLDATSRIVNMVTSFEIPFYIDYIYYEQGTWFTDFPDRVIKGTFTHSCLSQGTPVFIPVPNLNWIAYQPKNTNYKINQEKDRAGLFSNNTEQYPDFSVNGNTVTWSFDTKISGVWGDFNYIIFGGYRVMVGFF